MGDVTTKPAVTLKVIAEGKMEIVDSRIHVGGFALTELVDHLPSGRYVSPAKVAYGEARVTVEIFAVVPIEQAEAA